MGPGFADGWPTSSEVGDSNGSRIHIPQRLNPWATQPIDRAKGRRIKSEAGEQHNCPDIKGVS